ncbi:hypothetical protein EVG20_g9887 [Dentipellis fragilis]|uniref:GAG-pre-integrase domain-containing protein n=1 Tax=Dentipellis fragilis TaxID=205917 RepID=A0A4Y9XW45_9AGAM|nr:hypothetical protein EVG20_g9887 [Dentipellis fragilis]
MSDTNPKFKIAHLNGTNYRQWSEEMAAYLRTKRLWLIVNGSSLKPSPTPDNDAAVSDWAEHASQAAGLIFLYLDPSQRIHVQSMQDDPVLMWTTLASVHVQKRPGTRFNAYDDFFSICLQDSESLQSLMNRIDEGMRTIQNLRPDPYVLKDLDNELVCMAMVRSLPPEYSTFTSSLLLLDKLDRTSLQDAFRNEEINRLRRGGELGPSALKAAAPASAAAAKAPPRPKSNLKCDYCKRSGHTTEQCYKKAFDSLHPSQKANAVVPAAASGSSSSAPVPTEFAGSASLRSSSSPSLNDPPADESWNADTGATSHMTSHRHWFHSYSPFVTPIRLADNSVIYSAGIGSVQFVPLMRGKEQRAVLFSRVLHVPELRNNLLSVLYLTRHKSFSVLIQGNSVQFSLQGEVLFTARVDSSNTAFLEGRTVCSAQFAGLSSTLPLDLSLWHRRLGHHYHAGIQRLLREDLVTGLELKPGAPDPICEPCLAGKMHADPFPPSETRASAPLELIHTDLHGPLAVRSHSGYRYWISFIDDYSRFRVIYPLRTKGAAFDAFKVFKAYAENHFEFRCHHLWPAVASFRAWWEPSMAASGDGQIVKSSVASAGVLVHMTHCCL